MEFYRPLGLPPEPVADGRIAVPGERIRLSAEQVRHPHNEAMMAAGGLIGTGKKSTDLAEEADR